jgi:hypothetical protein
VEDRAVALTVDRTKLASIESRRTLEDYSPQQIRRAAKGFQLELRFEETGAQLRLVMPEANA